MRIIKLNISFDCSKLHLLGRNILASHLIKLPCSTLALESVIVHVDHLVYLTCFMALVDVNIVARELVTAMIHYFILDIQLWCHLWNYILVFWCFPFWSNRIRKCIWKYWFYFLMSLWPRFILSFNRPIKIRKSTHFRSLLHHIFSLLDQQVHHTQRSAHGIPWFLSRSSIRISLCSLLSALHHLCPLFQPFKNAHIYFLLPLLKVLFEMALLDKSTDFLQVECEPFLFRFNLV